MNVDTGEIRTFKSEKETKEFVNSPEQAGKWIPMDLKPTPAQVKRGRVGRNEPCPCASGKKFKHCHWSYV